MLFTQLVVKSMAWFGVRVEHAGIPHLFGGIKTMNCWKILL